MPLQLRDRPHQARSAKAFACRSFYPTLWDIMGRLRSFLIQSVSRRLTTRVLDLLSTGHGIECAASFLPFHRLPSARIGLELPCCSSRATVVPRSKYRHPDRSKCQDRETRKAKLRARGRALGGKGGKCSVARPKHATAPSAALEHYLEPHLLYMYLRTTSIQSYWLSLVLRARLQLSLRCHALDPKVNSLFLTQYFAESTRA